jgi:hypothetical protein
MLSLHFFRMRTELEKSIERLFARLKRCLRNVLLCFALTIVDGSHFLMAQTAPDYLSEVRPIFEAHCTRCHGESEQKGGLRLDSGFASAQGGDSGKVIIAGEPDRSLLMLAIQGAVADIGQMPLKRPPLDGLAQDTIRLWISGGASFPVNERELIEELRRKHWAFNQPTHVEAPVLKQSDWAINPIDAFVLGQLNEQELSVSPKADRATLIRRLSLDLIGLVPSIDDVEAFVNNNKQGAYRALVERLLHSPHYGERWARHWLDVARYADSNGYSVDNPRSIWPYRDWVIQSLNRDIPYDQFSIEQLAGDLLPEASKQQLIATGFHRNTQINEEGGIDKEQFRVDSVVDRVNTTGLVWLGLSVGCAQCHDHKFDPISQKEYYQFFSFFNNSDEPSTSITANDVLSFPKPVSSSRRGRFGRRSRGPSTMTIKERAQPRETFVNIKGDFTRPGDRVWPGTPSVLHSFEKGREANRLDLARWLFDDRNPLTARVMMNRVWQRYFGLGIVETENDFGTQGAKPSHPELLDWLALEFQRNGWSLRAMHRLIVNSATYQQSSDIRADLAEVDPYNRLLGRQSRHRLEAEIVRDVALEVSGLMTDKLGGPGVYPPQPRGVMDRGQRKRTWTATEGEDRFRRGLYTFFWRATPNPGLKTFDAPDAFSSCTRRVKSNTPLQALTLLNDPAFVEFSVGFARRILTQSDKSDRARISFAFASCMSRSPEEEELASLTRFLNEMRASLSENLDDAKRIVLGSRLEGVQDDELAAWVATARVLLNLDETISRP